jgi:hypothetical protein
MKKRLLLSGLLVLGFSAEGLSHGGEEHGGGAPLMSSDPCANMPPMMTPGGQQGLMPAPMPEGMTMMQMPPEGMAPPPPPSTGAPSGLMQGSQFEGGVDVGQGAPQGLMQTLPEGMTECPPMQAPSGLPAGRY